MKYLAVLGQNPELSLAELRAAYPGIKIEQSNEKVVVFESAEKIDLDKLGGIPKLAEVSGEGEAEKIVLEKLLALPREKKIFFGISFYGKEDRRLGLRVKNELKNLGRKARLVMGKDPALSSVIIKTNKLLTRGADFCVFAGFVAKTIAVQDFSDYEFRDMKRPARDLVSGMTPPKLAKIMINLAGGKHKNFLDPFCGSGTFLMEAALLGFKDICGSDISEKAVADSKKNFEWLIKNYQLSVSPLYSGGSARRARGVEIKLCDIKNAIVCWRKKFDVIAAEPYLGPPIRGKFDFSKAKQLQAELQKNYEKYLPALSSVLAEDGTLVLIAPFLITGKGELKLTLKIKENGLEAVRPPIRYSRPDQKVGREIYILKKL